MSCREKSALAKDEEGGISVSRKAELLGISRSSVYYEPAAGEESVAIMNAIDKIYTEFPFYGHRKIMRELRDAYGMDVGRKKTLSLMKKMGLEAVFPRKKPNLSAPDRHHRKYPYLLKGLPIIRPDHVWGTDITYVRTGEGFAYLTAILDWWSRYVVAWRLSRTLENDFCIESLKEALGINVPGIHNSDQGSQYTSEDYVGLLEEAKIRISMDGRGRCMDNIFTERLWRTVKYENVYLNDYADFEEAKQGLGEYFRLYNERRKHQSLGYKTPAQVYFKR